MNKTVPTLLLVLVLYSCSLPRVVVLDDPLSPEEHVNLGVIYEREGKYDEAIREYRKAAGELPEAYLYMGNAYFLKGDYEDAERAYREALRKDPLNADAMNNLAWLYYRWNRNLAEAESLARKAIRTNPERADIYSDTLRRILESRSDE